MSKVFNMVGGGGKNISSIIITGLESTDTITCTKDEKAYPAIWDSTAQHWEIVGLPLGSYTITATNGTKTKTETVLIDIAGVYDVEMSYNIILYKNGNEYEQITGGWLQPSNPSSGKKDDSIFLTNAYCYTSGKIELTNVTKIKAKVRTAKVSCTWSDYTICVAINDDTSAGILYTYKRSPRVVPSSNTEYTLELDVSAVTGEYNVMVGAYGVTVEMNVYEVWAE